MSRLCDLSVGSGAVFCRVRVDVVCVARKQCKDYIIATGKIIEERPQEFTRITVL